MHADVAGSGFSDDLPHLCIGAVRGDVVDNGGPGGQCLAGDAWLLGVNGENQFRSLGQALNHRDDAVEFLLYGDLRRARAGGLTADVENLRTLVGQAEGMRLGCISIEKPATVGE